ncbi:AI-2E family transporter [Nostocoides sp. F2B08]|uniref:AI-2E family transporter n=1 Tax=Nostocoides sp. F2B08 TaxID=2653936 RepID=UPI001263DCCB|nr:AI-2E family transporter [Tetrasphaera sp. F2B08]KAB7744021.1 AI-2E family transporter [Tetrasphaera sp. F2B08]
MSDHSGRQVVSAVPFGLLVSALVGLCFIVLSIAGYLLLRILNPVSPAITGIAFAVLLAGLLLPLKRAFTRVIPQDYAAAGLAMVTFLGGLIGLMYVTGAQLVSGFAELRESVFAALEAIQEWLRDGPLDAGEVGLSDYFQQAQDWVMGNSGSIVTGALAAGSRIGTFTVAAGLALVTAFFFLADGRRIWLWFISLLPSALEDRVDRAFSTGFQSVRAYVKTQAIVAAVDAVGIGLGALILGLPLVLPLTIVVFLASFVPVVGAFVSGALVVLIAGFSEGLTAALIMVGIVLLVQQIEGNVLQPLLMSKAVDLHPWGVIIGVTIGSYVYGIVGALFAVPVMAMIKVVVQSLRNPVTEPVGDPPGGPGWTEVLSNARTLGARALPARGSGKRAASGATSGGSGDAAAGGSADGRPDGDGPAVVDDAPLMGDAPDDPKPTT